MKPINPLQHVWWHRLRRLGPFGFVTLIGAVASPLLAIGLYSTVVIAYGRSWQTFVSGATTILVLTAPIYIGSCIWTWVYMEKRYRATLGVHCPGCGYAVHSGTSGRCPECGEPTLATAETAVIDYVFNYSEGCCSVIICDGTSCRFTCS